MQFSGFISDGYTRPGYLAAVDRQSPALRFTFRPMLQTARQIVLSQIRKNEDDPTKAEEIAARAVLSCVKEWDLKTDKGVAAPLNLDSVLRVEPNLLATLFRVVIGSIACDEDPEWGEAERKDQLEAALGEGADVKN